MHKTLVATLVLICFHIVLNAQVLVQKIPDENLCEIDFKLMQNGYKLAFSNMSSEDYVFKGREEEWKKCWTNILFDLKKFMQKNGLEFSNNTYCFNRIYFNRDGTIAAYLYHINGINAKQEQKFDGLIFQFLITQKVNLQITQNFWQYGTLRFE
ncbi:MAG TPA: hypothetical protein PK323_02060 [Bacteroidia bacterium]|nr:hypothetical protein [Bacteroidia bacterium]